MNDVDVLEASGPTSREDVRVTRTDRRWLAAHLVLLAGAAVVLVVANRGQWFFGDEWEFFVNRGFTGTALSIWQPHNEHWSTIPIAVFTVLRAVFGMGSYWPYIGTLIAVHLSLVHVLWRVAQRSGASPLLATVGAAVFSVFGAGAENLLWAFQIGFVGSLLLGWAAILVADSPRRELGRRDAVAAALLVGALMCSGIGVPMVVAAVVALVVRTRHLLRAVVVGAVPTVVFLVWYLAFGRVSTHASDHGGEGLRALLGQVRAGIVSLAHGALGGPMVLTKILLVLGVIAAGWALVGAVRGGSAFRQASAAVGGVVGLAAFLAMISVGRTTLDSSRYAYIAAALLLPAVVWGLTAISRVRGVQLALAALLVVVGVHNVGLLFTMADNDAVREAWVRATVTAAADEAESDPAVQGRPEPTYDPDITMAALREMVDKHGLPTGPVTPAGVNGVRLGLDVVVEPATSAPTDAAGADVEPAGDVVPSDDPDGSGGACWATAGPQPRVIVEEGTATLTLTSGVGGVFTLYVGDGSSISQPRWVVTAPDVPTVVVSSLPDGTPLRVDLPQNGGVVCAP